MKTIRSVQLNQVIFQALGFLRARLPPHRRRTGADGQDARRVELHAAPPRRVLEREEVRQPGPAERSNCGRRGDVQES